MKGPAVGAHAGEQVAQWGEGRAGAGRRPVGREGGHGGLSALEALEEGGLARRQVADGVGEGRVLVAQAGHGGQQGGFARGSGNRGRTGGSLGFVFGSLGEVPSQGGPPIVRGSV